MKRKVILEGELATKFGREFDIKSKTITDVIRCLDVNFPDFKKYLIEADERGIGFTCEAAGLPITDEKELLLEYPAGSIIISAVPAGSKGGAGKILLGAALVGLAVFAPYMVAAAAAPAGAGITAGGLFMANVAAGGLGAAIGVGLTAGGALSLIAAGIGVNLMLSGLQKIMAPDPSVDSQQDESYLFQGTTQQAVEGDPVPVLYGKLRVPGRPISSQIRNERQAFRNASAGAAVILETDNTTYNTDPSFLGGGQMNKFYWVTTQRD